MPAGHFGRCAITHLRGDPVEAGHGEDGHERRKQNEVAAEGGARGAEICAFGQADPGGQIKFAAL